MSYADVDSHEDRNFGIGLIVCSLAVALAMIGTQTAGTNTTETIQAGAFVASPPPPPIWSSERIYIATVHQNLLLQQQNCYTFYQSDLKYHCGEPLNFTAYYYEWEEPCRWFCPLEDKQTSNEFRSNKQTFNEFRIEQDKQTSDEFRSER